MQSVAQFIVLQFTNFLNCLDKVYYLPGVTFKWIILGFAIIGLLTSFVFKIFGAVASKSGRAIGSSMRSTRLGSKNYERHTHVYLGHNQELSHFVRSSGKDYQIIK